MIVVEVLLFKLYVFISPVQIHIHIHKKLWSGTLFCFLHCKKIGKTNTVPPENVSVAPYSFVMKSWPESSFCWCPPQPLLAIGWTANGTCRSMSMGARTTPALVPFCVAGLETVCRTGRLGTLPAAARTGSVLTPFEHDTGTPMPHVHVSAFHTAVSFLTTQSAKLNLHSTQPFSECVFDLQCNKPNYFMFLTVVVHPIASNGWGGHHYFSTASTLRFVKFWVGLRYAYFLFGGGLTSVVGVASKEYS